RRRRHVDAAVDHPGDRAGRADAEQVGARPAREVLDVSPGGEAVDRACVGAGDLPGVRLIGADEGVDARAAVDRAADRAGVDEPELVARRAVRDVAAADEVLDAAEARDPSARAAGAAVAPPDRHIDNPVMGVAAGSGRDVEAYEAARGG